MTNPNRFGNPSDPFNEDVTGLHTLPAMTPMRLAVRNMIRYMDAFQHDVQVEPLAEYAQRRSLRIDCSAPFDPEAGLFLNAANLLFGVRAQVILREPAMVSIGDLVVNGRITERWATLRRPNGPFGVTGVSKMNKRERFETMQSLTAVASSVPSPQGRLWAEPVPKRRSTPVAHQLTEEPGLCFAAHWESIQRVLVRKLNRLRAEAA